MGLSTKQRRSQVRRRINERFIRVGCPEKFRSFLLLPEEKWPKNLTTNQRERAQVFAKKYDEDRKGIEPAPVPLPKPAPVRRVARR